MDLDRIGDAEVGERLAAYNVARLSPDPQASARMRAEVLARGAAVREQPIERPRRWSLGFRRSLMVALVGVLAVAAGSSAALAASPGGPLYAAKVAIETALLPSSGDARNAAQLGQIGERVDEAGANSDPAAVAAALGEYQREVAGALAEAGDDADRLAKLQVVLAKHIAVLRALEKSNPAAAAAIENAIRESSQAIGKIEARQHASHPRPNGPPHDPPGPPQHP
jgi:hypothetical protein